MALRNIRPSFSEASPSTSGPSQSTSESTGSEPRHGQGTGGERDSRTRETGSTSSISKRRRVPESITRNACLNCKKARAKCDGKKPCTRCDTRSEHASCIYEVHIKHAKEELMKQITDLRAKDRQSERIYKALRSDIHGSEVLRCLKAGDSHDSIVEWLERESPSDHRDYDGYWPPVEMHHDASYPSADEMSHMPSTYWTPVKCEPAILRHLFTLYFTWIHPTATVLSERHFGDAYDRQSKDFCSSLLVNAICALACNLAGQPENDDFFEELGNNFAAAFRKEFDPVDKSITTIQATAITFLVELSKGSSRAAPYLKQATDGIAEVSALADITVPPIVLKTTIQGIRSLNVEWAQAMFECPLSLNPRPIENDTVVDPEIDLDSKFWYFYRFERDETPGWPSLLKTVNREKMKLINIIGDVCTMLYSPVVTKITAQQILHQYARFVAWSDALPDAITGVEKKSQALPHVLTLLILYNHSITQLLRPLIDLNDFPSLLVEETIFTHAQRGIHLLERYYRTQFTCRYQPCLQNFVVANLCDLVARYYPRKHSSSDKDGSEALIFGLDVLAESFAFSTGFPIADLLREMLRRAPASYPQPLKMPSSHHHLLSPPTKSARHLLQQTSIRDTPYSYEEFMDACTRATYFQPLWGVREKFEEGLAGKWVEAALRYGFRIGGGERALRIGAGQQEEKERSAAQLMQIKNLLNNS